MALSTTIQSVSNESKGIESSSNVGRCKRGECLGIWSAKVERLMSQLLYGKPTFSGLIKVEGLRGEGWVAVGDGAQINHFRPSVLSRYGRYSSLVPARRST